MPADALSHQIEVQCGIIQDHIKLHMERFNAQTVDQEVREKLETFRVEVEKYRVRFGEIDDVVSVPPTPVERMGVAVFCDMVGSTGSIVGMDFDHRGFVLNEFVNLAKDEVGKQGGFFDKFTGDGLIALFGVENGRPTEGEFDANLWQDACTRAWLFSRNVDTAMTDFNNRSEIRQIIRQNSPSRLRKNRV